LLSSQQSVFTSSLVALAAQLLAWDQEGVRTGITTWR
jgi:hypothetical protein